MRDSRWQPRTRRCAGQASLAWGYLMVSAVTLGAQVGDVSRVTWPGWHPADRVAPQVSVTHTYDSTARLYTYGYAVGNGAAAEQAIIEFWLRVTLPISRLVDPPGWESLYSADASNGAFPGAIFFATSDSMSSYEYGPAEAQIGPGQSLSGFSFTSAYPPGYVRLAARGFSATPVVPGDFDLSLLWVPHDTVNAQRRSVIGPYRYTGVRSEGTVTTCQGVFVGQPQCETAGADGFLGWMNLFWGDTVTSPLPIALKFSLHGETVFRETLSVKINGVDVTSYFFPDPTGNAGVVAVLPVGGSSPLREGENRIVTRVEGILPGTSTRTHDWDEFPFTVVIR